MIQSFVRRRQWHRMVARLIALKEKDKFDKEALAAIQLQSWAECGERTGRCWRSYVSTGCICKSKER